VNTQVLLKITEIVIVEGEKTEFMPYATVVYTQKEHVAHIILNRPEVDNIINQQLAQELVDICRQVDQDDSIYVAIVTGAGDRVFCGGSELEQLQQGSNAVSSLSPPALTVMNVATAIAGIEKPVIAAINGDALGPGLELALSCDIRLATPGARFGLPQVASGRIPMWGGTQRLPRIVGKGKALELILTAGMISAEEALEIGLVSRVLPQPELAERAEALAQSIASQAPIALRYIKEAVNKGLDLTLEQGLRLEADLYFLLQTTADRTEGITTFLEKRSPHFKGQ